MAKSKNHTMHNHLESGTEIGIRERGQQIWHMPCTHLIWVSLTLFMVPQPLPGVISKYRGRRNPRVLLGMDHNLGGKIDIKKPGHRDISFLKVWAQIPKEHLLF